MPYADPDKQREAKRRYEQEKRKQRRTNWMLVFYEDQCPEWRDELDELGMRTLVSPSHDADEWTARDEKKNPKHKAGTLKEPHRHLLAMYDNPVSYDQVVKAVQISGAIPKVHGAPLHIGDPAAIGVRDLAHPEFGDPVEIREGEAPVFWACGVTPQSIVMNSKPPFAITHAPGCMLITDTKNIDLKE